MAVAQLGFAVIATFIVCWSPWLYQLESTAEVGAVQRACSAEIT
jgi:hypothetical protein